MIQMNLYTKQKYIHRHRKQTQGYQRERGGGINQELGISIYSLLYIKWDFPDGSVGEESTCNAGDLRSTPGLGRSTGEGNDNPLQHSCLENPMDGGAWWAAVHGVAKSQTGLSDFPFTFHFHALEKEMATHSSILAWRIAWTEEPGGLQSMGLQS